MNTGAYRYSHSAGAPTKAGGGYSWTRAISHWSVRPAGSAAGRIRGQCTQLRNDTHYVRSNWLKVKQNPF